MTSIIFENVFCRRTVFYIFYNFLRENELEYYELEFLYWGGAAPNERVPPLKNCIRLLKKEGLIEIEQKEDEELAKCLAEIKIKNDKRIKYPVKYCLQRGRGTIKNIIRPTVKLLVSYLEYLKENGVKACCREKIEELELKILEGRH